MIANELKEKLKSGVPQIGTFAKLADPTVLEVLGMAGLDFAIIDTEHAPCDQMQMLDLVRTADSVGLPTIVRVPEATESNILKPLDIGASGVQIPGLSSVEEVKKALAYTKYTPEGERGLTFSQRSAGYGTLDKNQYMKDSNAGLINVVHIENADMAKETAKLCDIDAIDVLFIGPMDISQSLGHPGEPSHPTVAAVIENIIQICVEKKKPFGIFVGTVEAAKKYIAKGASYIAIASDIAFMTQRYKEIKNQILCK